MENKYPEVSISFSLDENGDVRVLVRDTDCDEQYLDVKDKKSFSKGERIEIGKELEKIGLGMQKYWDKDLMTVFMSRIIKEEET